MNQDFWVNEWVRLLETRAQTEDIRVLTLHQPYASFVALGLKRFETKSKPIYKFRGKILIHAAKAKCTGDRWDWFIKMTHQFPEIGKAFSFKKMAPDYCEVTALPYGCIVGIADLTDCQQMTPEMIKQQSALEIAVGYWQQWHYVLKLENVIAAPAPIPYKNNQGLQRFKMEYLTDLQRAA